MCAISFFFIEFSLRPFQCSVFFYCGLFRVGGEGVFCPWLSSYAAISRQ